jgi:Domain of unknown function (DUF4112)
MGASDNPIQREPPVEPDVALAVKLADWLDDRFIDPIVGLLAPGAGDLAMSLVGLYPIVVAIRHRMPPIIVARMMRNIAIDLILGAIPVVGDAFDFVFKAHRKNADLLLERHVLGPSSARDWAAVLIACIALLLALAAPFVAIGILIARLAN